MAEKLVPVLRFKGFDGKWEEKKLGDIASDFFAGGDVDVDMLKIKGRYPVLANALSNDGIVGYYDNFYRVEAPAITITGRGNVGHAQVRKVNFTPVVRLLVMKTKCDCKFIEEAINTKKIVVESTGVPQLTVPQVVKVGISLATSSEQQKIGKFMADLDKLIAGQKQRIEKLRNIKKALLEKLFPSKGEKIPSLRFRGFDGEWEEKKLGEIAKIIMGQSPDGSSYSDKPYGYILVQGNADLVEGFVKPRIWTTQMTKFGIAGDLIMSVRAPAGAMGKTLYDVVLGRGVAAIRGNDFLYYCLVKKDLEKYWKSLSCGSTFESLTSDDIKFAVFVVASTSEQQKIGKFMADLDKLIKLQSDKLAKLQNMKQACLRKMFV